MSIQNPLENYGLERIRMEEDDRYVWVYYAGKVENVVTKLTKENEELKAKLESVQASAYAESVDAGMENSRLKRALWLARAEKARYMAMIIDSFPYTQVLHFTSRKKDESGKPLGVARTAMEWWQMFQEVERKCRAKAEEL